MKQLTKQQISRMDQWMKANARPLDYAKWQILRGQAENSVLVRALLPYQNSDGGFGNGLEADIQAPVSAAIPCAEALFIAGDYHLDMTDAWVQALLAYLARTVRDIPPYWEQVPKEIAQFPHAPWWEHRSSVNFTPNPCAIIASAMLEYGTEPQRVLARSITRDCLDFLCSTEPCDQHACFCLIALIAALERLQSPLLTESVESAMNRRIAECVCMERSMWNNYHAQPLDFADSPRSPWYGAVRPGISENLDFWVDSLTQDGIWEPNFSWGTDNETAKLVSQQWRGYLLAKRFRILQQFGRIEA